MFGTGLLAPTYRRLVTVAEVVEAAMSDLRLRQRIAVVGNARVQPRHGELIDRHGMVIRFNSCWQYGESGRSTNVLVVNNAGDGGKHLAYAADAIELSALASAREFWLAAAPEVALARNEEDHTSAFIERRIGARRWRYIAPKTYRAAQNVLVQYGADDRSRPSAGLLALFHIRAHLGWRPITLFGFTHEGWHGHAWATERAAIDNWRGWRKLTRAD
jgi:hypothetical protein